MDQTQSPTTTEQVRRPNPTGKGGFADHPESINAGGRPKNQESFSYWMNFFKNLPLEELEGWKELNPKRSVAAELSLNRVLAATWNLKEFKEVADRTEGKPVQPTDITSGGKPIPILASDALSNNDSSQENS